MLPRRGASPVDRQAQAACRALLFFDLAVASFFEPVLPADEACCAVCLVPDFLAPDFFAVACDLPPDLAVLPAVFPAVLPAVFPVAFPAVLCRVPDFVEVADLSNFVAVAAGAVAGAAVLTWLPQFLKQQVPLADSQMWIGALVLLMMIFRPQGLIPAKRRAAELGGLDEAPSSEVRAVPAAGAL